MHTKLGHGFHTIFTQFTVFTQFTLSKAPGLRTSSPTQLVRMAVLLQGMPQLKEKEKVNRAKILSLHPLPFNYDRKVIDEDVWMMLAKCPTIVPTLRSSVLEKPFHEHYLQILKEEEETAGGVSTQILVLTLPGVNSEVVRTLGHPHREWKTIVEEKEDVNLVATRLKCSHYVHPTLVIFTHFLCETPEMSGCVPVYDLNL
uniref:Uncharacterized protein n=1 Tax=Caenorhabditis japonica TaxID=281687 RepID=A0A8R1ELY7_CAEJA